MHKFFNRPTIVRWAQYNMLSTCINIISPKLIYYPFNGAISCVRYKQFIHRFFLLLNFYNIQYLVYLYYYILYILFLLCNNKKPWHLFRAFPIYHTILGRARPNLKKNFTCPFFWTRDTKNSPPIFSVDYRTKYSIIFMKCLINFS